MRKRVLLYGFFLMATIARSQSVTPPHAKEFSFITDNDAYLFRKKDANYTNGFFFNLRMAKEKKGNKIIQGIQLGQMIYTPLIRKSTNASDVDRPYCGYLFLRYDHTRFFSGDAFFQYNAGIGEVGKDSFGEDVQNSYHSLLGYGRFSGWQYQVRNALGGDLGATYARTVFENSSWIKLVPIVQANLGMNFTNAHAGAYLCLGLFEKNANSALWNARVQYDQTITRRKYELFFYYYPQVIAQGYNSTVQGGLFNKGTGAVLKDIEPWMVQQNLGVCYGQGRWSTNIALIYQSREANTQTNPQAYGSVQVSYRFH